MGWAIYCCPVCGETVRWANPMCSEPNLAHWHDGKVNLFNVIASGDDPESVPLSLWDEAEEVE